MVKSILDTNILLRFFVNDDPQKASDVEKLLKQKNSYILLDLVIAEIVWVLASYYEVSKEDIIEKIEALIHVPSIECNKSILEATLALWKEKNISFIDAYLVAQAQEKKLPLYTYDKKVSSIKTVTTKEP